MCAVASGSWRSLRPSLDGSSRIFARRSCQSMRVSVFGLGYVGCVTAACLVKAGHQVLGVDINGEKVSMVNDGISPLLEPGLGDLLHEVVANRRLGATTSTEEAIAGSDVALICVGTPSRDNGASSTSRPFSGLSRASVVESYGAPSGPIRWSCEAPCCLAPLKPLDTGAARRGDTAARPERGGEPGIHAGGLVAPRLRPAPPDPGGL